MSAPTDETREKQSVFVKTLAAIRNIFGDREEIMSRVIVDELARIEGGPWAEWGKGRKPSTDLTRLYPVQVTREYRLPLGGNKATGT